MIPPVACRWIRKHSRISGNQFHRSNSSNTPILRVVLRFSRSVKHRCRHRRPREWVRRIDSIINVHPWVPSRRRILLVVLLLRQIRNPPPNGVSNIIIITRTTILQHRRRMGGTVTPILAGNRFNGTCTDGEASFCKKVFEYILLHI